MIRWRAGRAAGITPCSYIGSYRDIRALSPDSLSCLGCVLVEYGEVGRCWEVAIAIRLSMQVSQGAVSRSLPRDASGAA